MLALGGFRSGLGVVGGTCGGSQDYVIGGGLRVGQVSFSRGLVGVGVRIGCGWVGVCILIGLELEVGLELGLSYTFAGGGVGVRLELG